MHIHVHVRPLPAGRPPLQVVAAAIGAKRLVSDMVPFLVNFVGEEYDEVPYVRAKEGDNGHICILLRFLFVSYVYGDCQVFS